MLPQQQKEPMIADQITVPGEVITQKESMLPVSFADMVREKSKKL